jgi:succinoglycan biosynthesis protein ExoA
MAGTDAQDVNRLNIPVKPDVPFVTVIMPVRNEGDFIARSLGAVLAQDYPHHRLEVIISDGLSHDQTRSVARKTAAQCPDVPVTIIDNPGRIVAVGLNIALSHMRGDIIVRVDGHCEIAPDYISRCVAHLQANDDFAGVGGSTETIGTDDLSAAIAVAMSSPFGVGGSAFRTLTNTALLADTVPFPAYKRSAIEAAGPYDEELVRNQDDEYNYRLRKLGYGIFLAPDVRSRYYSRASLDSLWRQYFGYGFWKVRVLQKHPRQMQSRQFAPPGLATALVGSALLSPVSIWGRRLFALVAGLYALANLAASIYTAYRRGWRYMPYLPMIFATLHLSYGIGFLVGLVKFRRRWNG